MAGEQSKKRSAAAKQGDKDAAQAAGPEQQAKTEAEAKAAEQDKDAGGKDAGGAKDAGGGVRLEVSTRQPKRIRAGVTVTRQPSEVSVTEDQAKRLEADRHIRVKRL